MDRQQILLNTIAHYGIHSQIDMAIEEMSELTKALLKDRRNSTDETLDNIHEEMVDVQIMLDQLKIIFGWSYDWDEKKLKRMEDALK